MVLEALTPEDQRRHTKAIAKLRAELFREFPPAHYFIVPGSEKVLPASAEAKWMEGEGHYRVLRLGGLAFLIDCADPEGHATLTIRHEKGTAFCFWLSAAKGYTVTAATAEFKDLGRSVRMGIRLLLAENWWSVFCNRYNPPKS